MTVKCPTCGHKPLNGNRMTVTLTHAQLLALREAAGRGIDEWDYEPDDPCTPNTRVRKSALAAYRIVYQTLTGGNP